MKMYGLFNGKDELVKFYRTIGAAKGAMTQAKNAGTFVPKRVYDGKNWVQNPNYEKEIRAQRARFDKWSIATFELVEVNRITGKELEPED